MTHSKVSFKRRKQRLLIYLHKNKYEILLLALVQHLFFGVFVGDMSIYLKIIWPINMFFLGVASVGIFVERGRWVNIIRELLFILVMVMPLLLTYFGVFPHFMTIMNEIYIFFFLFIFVEVFKFLIRPSYINIDIISAAACGYFLLLEIAIFLMQLLYHSDPKSFSGIDASSPAKIFIDMIYFCSMTFTSIGFGDITPTSHSTKLLASFFGIIGQFYSVILVGIIISKFGSTNRGK
jgi:hypothetical protein